MSVKKVAAAKGVAKVDKTAAKGVAKPVQVGSAVCTLTIRRVRMDKTAAKKALARWNGGAKKRAKAVAAVIAPVPASVDAESVVPAAAVAAPVMERVLDDAGYVTASDAVRTAHQAVDVAASVPGRGEYDAACIRLRKAVAALAAVGQVRGPKGGARRGNGMLSLAAAHLKETGGILTAKAIADAAQAAGWVTEGLTPEATVSSGIGTEIRKAGEGSRFRKAGRGLYAYHTPGTAMDA